LTSDSDTDVVRRRWLLLDFDPRRPTKVPSTDAEHQSAREAAAWCRQWLESLGWPAPIFASSGNGYHLLYRIDLPNDQESANLVQNVLEAVAASVAGRGTDGPAVDLDRKVFNAARKDPRRRPRPGCSAVSSTRTRPQSEPSPGSPGI